MRRSQLFHLHCICFKIDVPRVLTAHSPQSTLLFAVPPATSLAVALFLNFFIIEMSIVEMSYSHSSYMFQRSLSLYSILMLAVPLTGMSFCISSLRWDQLALRTKNGFGSWVISARSLRIQRMAHPKGPYQIQVQEVCGSSQLEV